MILTPQAGSGVDLLGRFLRKPDIASPSQSQDLCSISIGTSGDLHQRLNNGSNLPGVVWPDTQSTRALLTINDCSRESFVCRLCTFSSRIYRRLPGGELIKSASSWLAITPKPCA
jgi:hypothetical protein